MSKPQFFLSKTGDIIVYEREMYSSNWEGIYIICLRHGFPAWDYRILSQGAQFLTSIQIEDAPCGGYVLSYTAGDKRGSPWLPSPAASDVRVLHHIKEDGAGGAYFTYLPFPEPTTVDTEFIPGFTHKEWGSQLNGQTYDFYYRTISFPTENKPEQEAGKLVIMPNPSSNAICMAFNGESTGIMNITITDRSGKIVDRFQSRKDETSWMIPYQSTLPAGMYSVSVRLNGAKPVITKWVKVK